MDMNNVNIEEIVKQVLSGMTGNAPAAASAPAASKTFVLLKNEKKILPLSVKKNGKNYRKKSIR